MTLAVAAEAPHGVRNQLSESSVRIHYPRVVLIDPARCGSTASELLCIAPSLDSTNLAR